MENLTSVHVLQRGVGRTARGWSTTVAVYVLSLLLSIPMAMAFRNAMSGMLGEFPAVGELFGGFSATIFSDILRAYRPAFSAFISMLWSAVYVSVVVHSFVGFGIVSVIEAEGDLSTFLRGIGLHAGRAFRLFLITLVFGTVLVTALSLAGSTIASATLPVQAVEDDYALFVAILLFFVLVPVSIVSLTSEYARVYAVRENARSMWRCTWDGFKFVVRHPLRMLFVHGSILLTIALLYYLYWTIERAVGMTSIPGVILMAFIQQIVVFLRVSARVWNSASAVVVIGTLTRKQSGLTNVPEGPSAEPIVPTSELPVPPAEVPTTPVHPTKKRRRQAARVPRRTSKPRRKR